MSAILTLKIYHRIVEKLVKKSINLSEILPKKLLKKFFFNFANNLLKILNLHVESTLTLFLNKFEVLRDNI